jgi:hypothetical protein
MPSLKLVVKTKIDKSCCGSRSGQIRIFLLDPEFSTPVKDLIQTEQIYLFFNVFFQKYLVKSFIFIRLTVPDNKSRNIPEVDLVRRWAVGVLGIWRGGVGWFKGGANGVSLQAT